MSRRRKLGTKKTIALLASAAAVAGGGAFVLATTGFLTVRTQNGNDRIVLGSDDTGIGTSGSVRRWSSRTRSC